MNIDFTPSWTVERFMHDDNFVRAIVGPIGSGKSSGCIMEILKRSMEQRPGPDKLRRTRWLIVRNTYRELEDTTRKTFEQWIPLGFGRWYESDFTFHIKFRDVDSEVLFRALDKPGDVGRLLSMELTGAYLNEMREIPKEAFDIVQGRVGRYPSKAQGGPSWFGVWGDTNPWPTSSTYYKLFTRNRPKDFSLYEQPSGLGPAAENLENLPGGYYERLQQGKDQEWIDEYLKGEYPSNDKGSIYGDWLHKLEQAGRIEKYKHPTDGVFVVFDLGVSDSTAMWFFRFGEGGGVDVIDWYEAHGFGASHYFDQLARRRYTYSKIYLPHDARNRSFQTGVSTMQQFNEEFPGLIEIVPSMSIEDGISAGRWLLEQMPRFHERCETGIERLRSYKYEWDEDKKVFSKKPLHDFASHTADAWRYLALMVKRSERLDKRRLQPAISDASPARPIDKSFSLDELWDARAQAMSGRRNRI